MGWFGKNSANNSARQYKPLPLDKGPLGAPPTPGTRRLPNVPARPKPEGTMTPEDIAAEKQKGWEAFKQKEYGGVTKPDSPMGAANKSNLRNYGGYNGPAGNYN